MCVYSLKIKFKEVFEMLFLETLLTIIAWKKGWQAMALLPMGIGIVVAYLFGMVCAATNVSMGTVYGIGIAFDIAVLLILLGMIGAKSENAVKGQANISDRPSETQAEIQGA
jgi:Na+-transporting methylmalonyl-CoA/oxaloacetate decarboxylase beta subunit